MKKDKLLKIAKYVVILLIFFFIFRYLYLNFSNLKFSDLKFNAGFLLLSVLIYLLHLLCNALIWHVITMQNHCAINIFEAIKLRVYSDFGKYIPGKVFTYGILLFSYEKHKVPKKTIAACSIQEFIISMLAAVVLSFFSIFISDIQGIEHYKFIFLILALACLLIVYAPLLQFVMNVFFRIFKKEKIVLTTSFGKIILTLFLFLNSWLIFGWSFYFFINSFYSLPVTYYFFITGAFAIAGIIGFVSVFAPAGLGVREGVMIFTLSFALTAAISSLISLLSRIWMTLCEILLFAVVFTFNLIFKRKNHKVQE
jgi:glycosyltransferase 2 family protein